MCTYRDTSGFWKGLSFNIITAQLQSTIIRQWTTDAGWDDVAAARVSRLPASGFREGIDLLLVDPGDVLVQ